MMSLSLSAAGRIFFLLFFFTSSGIALAGEVLVAVASNFQTVARQLGDQFESLSGHKVKISATSTGKLYAQIIHGAPFELFLAADVERPKLLDEQQLIVPGSRRTYAIGELMLWSINPKYAGQTCRDVLTSGDYQRISVANPQTAPYGAAAKQTLEALQQWDVAHARMVTGENIAQALQFVASGGADLGFIAAVQLHAPDLPETVCQWKVPATMHAPIEQQMVLLTRAADNPVAQAFFEYLQSDAALARIRSAGYTVPEH